MSRAHNILGARHYSKKGHSVSQPQLTTSIDISSPGPSNTQKPVWSPGPLVCSACKTTCKNACGLKSHFGIHQKASSEQRVETFLHRKRKELSSQTEFLSTVSSASTSIVPVLASPRMSAPSSSASSTQMSSSSSTKPSTASSSTLTQDSAKWHQTFVDVQLSCVDAESLDQETYDQKYEGYSKFLFEANARLPGPVHPAVKMFRQRKKNRKLAVDSAAAHSKTSNPQRTDKKRRERTRAKFAYELAQHHYYNQRRKVVRMVMEDGKSRPTQCPIEIGVLHQHFLETFAEPNDCSLETYPTRRSAEDITVSLEDVEQALKSMSLDSSPGEDRILVRTVRELKIAPTIKTIIDICLVTGKLPSKLKNGKTILIHKGGPVEDVNNWRPITIYSVIRRIVEKVLDRHLRRQLDLNSNQRGFRSGMPGCHINA
ncbi:hypothetical protein, partial [Clostridioides difficile]|uniref:hypothetical protein n=1 Tax=Clostridioides difficile TaxID=1496 RepID=UPI0013EFAA0D